MLLVEDFEKYYIIAANFLSYRNRSEKEIRDKLRSKSANSDIIEKVVATLKEQKFVNDEQFAREWIRSRTTYRMKSKRIIKIELLKKGIDRDLIDRVMNEGTEETGPVNDLEQAKKLAESRIGKYKGMSKNEIYQKLGGFLARRGFSWETIKTAIDQTM